MNNRIEAITKEIIKDYNVNYFYNQIMNKCLADLYNSIADASVYYPDFNFWYKEKVIPGIINRTRDLIMEYRDGIIAGISIVKHEEKKLCTLRVLDPYLNKGIGLKLFDSCFSVLETEKPFLTVSEEKLPEFEKLFKYYGFKLTSIHKDLYRKNKIEYFYNEGC